MGVRHWRCPVASWVLLCAKSLTLSLLFLTSPLPGYASVLFGTGFGYDAANIWGTSIKCLVSSWLFQTFPSIWLGLTIQAHFQHLLMDIWISAPPPSHMHSLKTIREQYLKQVNKEGGRGCRTSAGRWRALWNGSTVQCCVFIHSGMRHWPCFNRAISLLSEDVFPFSHLHSAPPPVWLQHPWKRISKTMQGTVHKILAELWWTNACWYLQEILFLVHICCFTVVPHQYDHDWHDVIWLWLIVMYLSCDSLMHETIVGFLPLSWNEICPVCRNLIVSFVCPLNESAPWSEVPFPLLQSASSPSFLFLLKFIWTLVNWLAKYS